MRLICLNIWCGRRLESLLRYIAGETPRTDIFCFQEMRDGPDGMTIAVDGTHAETYRTLQRALPEFQPFFEESERDTLITVAAAPAEGLRLGQAAFVRRGIEVRETGKRYIARTPSMRAESGWTRPRVMQYLHCAIGGAPLTVCNVHGLLDDGHKRDTPARLEQSRIISEFLAPISHPKILCGDFNAYLETESVRMLETEMRNLVREYGIVRTRNRFYADMEKYQDYLGDYVLVSPEVMVKDFAVPDADASDHLPLVLDFTLHA